MSDASPPPLPPRRSQLKSLLLMLLIVVALVVIVMPPTFVSFERARMAEEVSNIRSIKMVFDSFAMDNDGVYPNEDLASYYGITSHSSSNDLFRQLFASGNINSEKIFWSSDSPVCSPSKPDDITTIRGIFDEAITLEPGDNHWAYFIDLTIEDDRRRPIMVESYIPHTTNFPDDRIIVLRIDGSAKPEPVTSTGIILDKDGNNLLSTTSKAWTGTTPDLRQPDP